VQGNSFTITNGPGRLFGQTLLPASADVAVITNFEVDGVPHPPSAAGAESGGTRLEISPQEEGARDYFLHLLDATDPSQGAPPAASVAEDGDNVRLAIDHGRSHVELSFAKTGDLGGHLTVTQGGTTVCDQDLGEFASGAGGGGAGGGGAGPGGAGGGSGDAASGDDDGGCGCRLAGGEERPSPAAAGGIAVTLLALLARWRRARPRSPRS
jgi:hypothetical protein